MRKKTSVGSDGTFKFQINLVLLIFQLSFIMQSLRHPDVFCFADYLTDVVVCDILKSAPSDDDREVSTWWEDDVTVVANAAAAASCSYSVAQCAFSLVQVAKLGWDDILLTTTVSWLVFWAQSTIWMISGLGRLS